VCIKLLEWNGDEAAKEDNGKENRHANEGGDVLIDYR
jgi:hypothetical protein